MALKNHIIIGGGASGIFAAISCAESLRSQGLNDEVIVLEASKQFLKKVKISGGGRCNVTHNQFNIKDFCENYPRGERELRSPFHQFQALNTVEWFRARGVRLKAEDDGRMFPTTDQSQTIIDCLLKECHRLGVKLLTGVNIKSAQSNHDGRISLLDQNQDQYLADSLLISTGSMPGGYKLARQLGHDITDLAPSLFTFKIEDRLLEGLAGISFEKASLQLIAMKKKFDQFGPLLITHWGLSGPALLKLSAWAAREMKQAGYKALLKVNWLGISSKEALELVSQLRRQQSRAKIGNRYPEQLSKRFWHQLLMVCHIDPEINWADLSNKKYEILIQKLIATELSVNGKSRFKEEFVECGGVDLKQINFKTMESKLCSGLFFAGEVMDIDGVTGGFNFQNAWTSGFIAGQGMSTQSSR